MKKFLFLAFAIFCTAVSVAALAQAPAAQANLAGTWQGTLHVGKGPRTVVKVTPDGAGGWKGEFYSIDQVPTPFPLDSITLQGAEVAFELHAFNVKYHGTLSADGNAIKGTMTQGAETLWISSAPRRPRSGRSTPRRTPATGYSLTTRPTYSARSTASWPR